VKIQTDILLILFAVFAFGRSIFPETRTDAQSVPVIARIDNMVIAAYRKSAAASKI